MLKSFFLLSALAVGLAAKAETDYTQGLFIVNEDWYGHQNSTVNYILPDDPDGDYWHYRVFQSENPGHELGCTNQYGAIYQGRFYLIAKQAKDPGAEITGGRITVADARTMKLIYQSELIDPSGAQCDGRSFIGVTPEKGYISTSNGVWVLDLSTFEVVKQVEGSGNPESGNLYKGQSGTMVEAAGRVFAAHQSEGLLVLDPVTDKVTDVISMDIVAEGAGIGSVVKAKDGMLYLSVAKNVNGDGSTLPYLVRVDPETLQTEVIALPEGVDAPKNSWYAWTPDGFCASATDNVLYWNGGSDQWFSPSKIYRYDIASGTAERIIDFEEEPGDWNLYGCSMRPHPVTGELYISLYHQVSDPTYILRRYSAGGEPLKDYPMISNYWFPSLPVFPQADTSGVDDIPLSPACAISCSGGLLLVAGMSGEQAEIYTLAGALVASMAVNSDTYSARLALPSGIYIVKVGHLSRKISI